MPVMLGQTLGTIQIVREIAEGGMGMVYEGIHTHSGRRVAIKTLRQELVNQPDDILRFQREAEIYQQLAHPNLMAFYGSGSDERCGYYLVTEYLEGRDLEEAIAALHDKPMPIEQALDIALQICAGLSAAHQRGIVHRDLKPGNIFLVKQDDGQEVAKVFDFGIAKILDAKKVAALTMDGAALGTPLYMAPEQIRGNSTGMGTTIDIYALGIMLYQMLAGIPPFTGHTHMELLAHHLRTPPPLLRQAHKRFAGSKLETLLTQMMAKEPLERPQQLEHVIEQLWAARRELNPEPIPETRFELPNFDALQSLIQQNNTPEPPSQSPTAVLLLKEHGKDKEVGWLLPGDTMTIGSGPDDHVRLRIPGLHPQHAEIHCAPKGWITLKALPPHVVRVNGAAITNTVLRDGDWITLGQTELKLHCFK